MRRRRSRSGCGCSRGPGDPGLQKAAESVLSRAARGPPWLGRPLLLRCLLPTERDNDWRRWKPAIRMGGRIASPENAPGLAVVASPKMLPMPLVLIVLDV